ncbi:MAG: alpha/beta fold hydrolase, partial [Actinomycetales bacterium]
MMGAARDFRTLPDGARLRVADTGGDAPTIVLVHGWKQSHRLFDQVTQRLRSKFRVIAFDQRGMGESDKDLRVLPGLSFDLLAADLDNLLEQLDATAITLVGWSMGCTTALSLMQRPNSRVQRVMLVNGPLRLTRTHDFPWALDEQELAGYVEGMEDAWPTDQHDFL